MTHLVCGYPSLEISKEIFKILDQKSEYIEIQFPFSDPIADGPIITHANEVSVKNGTTVEDCFSFIQDIIIEAQSKIIIMTYYNIILQYGVKKFIHRAKTLGIYAIIIPDIPNDERDGIQLIEECKKNDIHFIYIVYPNIGEHRLKEIGKYSTGFLYAISNNMTTGNTGKFEKEFIEYIQRLKKYTHIPIGVGFGVKTKSDLDKICNFTEFGVIGSELISIYGSEGKYGLIKYLDNLVK